MAQEAADIENRPEELFKLPNYGCLPSGRFQIDLNGALGDFLGHDLFDLDGCGIISKSELIEMIKVEV